MKNRFRKHYLAKEHEIEGSTGTTPKRGSELDHLILSFDQDEDDIYEMETMYTKDQSFYEDSSYNVNTRDKLTAAAPQGMISSKMKAIIFINIYCVFDTVDNINAKSAMEKGVDFLDLAFGRIAMNFVSACFFVYYFRQ